MNPPKLLDLLEERARAQGQSASAAMWVSWCRGYILFHGKRHPQEMELAEVGRYLEHVAATARDPLPALEMARSGLSFLYRELLHRDLGEMPTPSPPRLLDQVRQVMRVRHYARRTEECYVQWVRRYILFHEKRHPRDMGAAEAGQFLTHLAVHGQVSASTQNQALNAIVFLYGQVLGIDLGRFEAQRARRPKRLPVVLSPEEVQRVLARIEGGEGLFSLMARLLYGCGSLKRAGCG